jgi:actin-related protein
VQDTLDKIKEADSSTTNLLEFLYENHAPKKDTHKLDKELMESNLKKTVSLAMLHYAGDKNQSYGDEWRVLCEEISKTLGVHFNKIKGVV